MPLQIKDAHKIDDSSFSYVFEENAVISLKTGPGGVIRCNVYRPKANGEKFPVLVTYGPYGKDIHYNA